jgi:hypothetical protein
MGINSCGQSKHSDCSFFFHGYLEEEKSMIHSRAPTTLKSEGEVRDNREKW